MQDELQAETNDTNQLFENKMYKIAEISDILSMGKSTIYLYIKQSLFPKGQVLSSRLTLYSGKILNDWVENVMPQLNHVSRQPVEQRKKFY